MHRKNIEEKNKLSIAIIFINQEKTYILNYKTKIYLKKIGDNDKTRVKHGGVY